MPWTRPHATAALSLLTLCAGAHAPPAYASDAAATRGGPHAVAHRTTDPPRIDGKLDDPAWQSVPSHGDFVERQPRLRSSPPVDTRFTVLFDHEALYFAVRAQDDQPENIRAQTRTRDDFAMFGDDVISIKIDPTLDRRTTIGFAINAGGAKLDYRGIDEQDFRIEFDAVWQGAARRTKNGWTAELRIPFAALGIQPANRPAIIGLNLTRDHARRNGSYDWALMAPPFSPIAASRYGTMSGLDAKLDGRLGDEANDSVASHVALVPYAIGGFRREAGESVRSRAKNEAVLSGGVDALAQLGSYATHLTLNTDFAQVDLDNQIVNFSRFGLFLPEKRDFFLRDLEVLSFGKPGHSQLLYSRRIGLYDGNTVPIMAGAKTVGRPHDKVRVGVLQVTTRPTDVLPWTSHAAARSTVELGGGSNTGVMLTHRGSLENSRDHNVAFGVDGTWRGEAVPLLIRTAAFGSVTGADAAAPDVATGGTGNGAFANRVAPGGGVEVSLRDELFHPRASYAYLHPELRTDLGFLQRVGVHQTAANLDIQPTVGAYGIRRVVISQGISGVVSAEDDQLLDWQGSGNLKIVWDAGFAVGAYASRGLNTVTQAFEVGRNTPVPAKPYRTREALVYFNTPNTQSLSANGLIYSGLFYDGTMTGFQLHAEWAPVPLFRLRGGSDYRHIVFDDDREGFDSLTLNSRFTFGFTTKLSLNSYAGYNLIADLVRVQNRLRWTYLPGSDIFIVQQMDLHDDSGAIRNTSFLVKTSYHWP